MGFKPGHKGFKGKSNKLKAGLKEKVEKILEDQERILAQENVVNRDSEVTENGMTNSGVNNRDVVKVILDYVKERLPKCMELIREAEGEEDSNGQTMTRNQAKKNEAIQNIIDACELEEKCGRKEAMKVINLKTGYFQFTEEHSPRLGIRCSKD